MTGAASLFQRLSSPPKACIVQDRISTEDSQLLSNCKRREIERHSTPQPTRSMTPTPPPSSQPEPVEVSHLEPPHTPNAHSQLSSPPPTVKASNQQRANSTEDGLYTQQQIERATAEQLRDMVTSLKLQVQDARTAMAHYKLQYTLLSLDSENAANQMAMELAGAQREIEVLMEAEERRRNEIMTPLQTYQDANAANTLLLHEVTRRCTYLESQNEELKEVLERTQANLEHAEGQVSSLSEENELLRSRIRTNREHMNGLLDYVNERSPQSHIGTPAVTPRSRINQRFANESSQLGTQPFEALLLADKVLSQEVGAAPTTPTRPKQRGSGHKRNARSVSSMPATPKRSRNANNNPQTPMNPPLPKTMPHTVGPLQYLPDLKRRRASSDSTITASSVDSQDMEHMNSHRTEDDVPESEASQAATSLLRSFPSSQKSKEGMGAGNKSVQTKIFGHVRKSNVSRSSDAGDKSGEPAAKRTRVSGGGVGLGIGLAEALRR